MTPEKLIEVAQNLRQVVDEVARTRKSGQLGPEAIEALCDEVHTAPFLFDMWLEETSEMDIKEALLRTADKLENSAKREQKPDDLSKILTQGQDWGRIAVPPRLLRSMWRIGEIIDLFFTGQVSGSCLEEEAMSMMLAAREWVRFHKQDGDTQQVEVLTLEAQQLLRDANANRPKDDGNRPPF